MNEKKYLAIETQVAQALVDYLATLPFKDVSGFINILTKMPEVSVMPKVEAPAAAPAP